MANPEMDLREPEGEQNEGGFNYEAKKESVEADFRVRKDKVEGILVEIFGEGEKGKKRYSELNSRNVPEKLSDPVKFKRQIALALSHKSLEINNDREEALKRLEEERKLSESGRPEDMEQLDAIERINKI